MKEKDIHADIHTKIKNLLVWVAQLGFNEGIESTVTNKTFQESRVLKYIKENWK